jgi:DNA-binding NarL/FixJ family response regulator
VHPPSDAGPSAIVVEDHHLFREGVTDLLREHGISVAAAAGTAAGGIAPSLQTDPPLPPPPAPPTAADAIALASETKPDVALMDLNLPDASGIEATKRLRIVSPLTRVLVLTVSATEADITAALEAGACGYLLKDAPPEEIVAGTLAAAAGHSFLSPRIAALLLDRFRESSATLDLPDDLVPTLTERELEVLSLLAAGKENGEIADLLVISQHTVKNHVSGILAKLELENRIQAAVYAVRNGLD